jgi:hypothetical protein
MLDYIPENQMPKIKYSSSEAKAVMDKIYAEVMEAIERGDDFYIETNFHTKDTPEHTDHVIRTIKV